MKIVRRYCVDLIAYAYFICTGIRYGKHQIYFRVTKDGDIIEDGGYYQQRTPDGLKMFHI